MRQTMLSVGLFILTALGFLASWVTGFSYGRYFVVGPLLLTAFAVTLGKSAILKLIAFAAAALVWGIFSFALFGILPLEKGFLVQFVACAIAYVVSFAARRGAFT
jgi:hypothetical protein